MVLSGRSVRGLLVCGLVVLFLGITAEARAEYTGAAVVRNGSGRAVLPLAREFFEMAPRSTNKKLYRASRKVKIVKFDPKTGGSLEAVLEVARAEKLDVVFLADVEIIGKRRRSRPSRIHVTALDVKKGETLGSVAVRVTSRGRGRKRRLVLKQPAQLVEYVEKVYRDLDASRLRESKEPQPYVSPTPAKLKKLAAALKRPRWTHANRTVVFGTYGLLFSRNFSYFDTITRNLLEFGSGLSYGLGARIEVYPFSFDRASGTTRRVGFIGGYAQDFGIQPAVSDAPEVDLTHEWSEWYAGAVYAWDFAPVLAKASATYGRSAALFSSQDDFESKDELPSVDYEMLSIGIDVRGELPEIAVFAAAQYMFIRNGGAVEEGLFPNTAIGGVRARGGLAYPLFSTIEALAALRYDRFYYDLRPSRGDEFLAGGALDEQWTFELGLNYAY